MSPPLARKIIVAAAIAAATLLILIILGYVFAWPWVGVTAITVKDNGEIIQYYRPKTLWDWLELLIIPLVLAAGGLWFNYTQKQTELATASQQRKQDRMLAQQAREQDLQIAHDRRKQDLEIARQEREQDLQIARDLRQQDLLQAYFDRISTLLLEHDLRNKREDDAEERTIARARTLTVLRSVDSERKGQVVQFLTEAGLVQSEPGPSHSAIVPLVGADLSGTNLIRAYWVGADLRRADLTGSDLRGAHLKYADLRGANLTGVDLSWANLDHADLRDAKVTRQAVNTAQSTFSTMLPDSFLDDPPSDPDTPQGRSVEP